jgi:plastocyanin
MIRITLTILAVVAAAAFLAATAGARSAGLTGEVGPGFTIEVVNAAGKDVKTLKAGTYTIRVEDKATIHNFHLMGSGVNKRTGVSFKGTQTWTVTFRPGRYTYQCDPHAATGMKGSFRVTG